MSRQPTRYWFTIPTEDIVKEVEIQGVEGLLDMLRYDHAVVEGNAPGGYHLFSIEGHEPEVARWRSFGFDHLRQWDPVMWRHSDEPFLKQVLDPKFTWR